MKEMLRGNNWECFLRSASDKKPGVSFRLQFRAKTQAITSTLPTVLLQSTASSASDRKLSKNISSSPGVIYSEENPTMYTSSKPLTHVRVTGEPRTPSSQGEVSPKMSNPKLLI